MTTHNENPDEKPDEDPKREHGRSSGSGESVVKGTPYPSGGLTGVGDERIVSGSPPSLREDYAWSNLREEVQQAKQDFEFWRNVADSDQAERTRQELLQRVEKLTAEAESLRNAFDTRGVEQDLAHLGVGLASSANELECATLDPDTVATEEPPRREELGPEEALHTDRPGTGRSKPATEPAAAGPSAFAEVALRLGPADRLLFVLVELEPGFEDKDLFAAGVSTLLAGLGHALRSPVEGTPAVLRHRERNFYLVHLDQNEKEHPTRTDLASLQAVGLSPEDLLPCYGWPGGQSGSEPTPEDAVRLLEQADSGQAKLEGELAERLAKLSAVRQLLKKFARPGQPAGVPVRTPENEGHRDELVRELRDAPDIEAAQATLKALKEVLAERGERVLCAKCGEPGYLWVGPSGSSLQFQARHGKFEKKRPEHNWPNFPEGIRFRQI